MPVRGGGGHNHWRDLAKAVLIKGGCIRLAHELRPRTEASGGLMNNLPCIKAAVDWTSIGALTHCVPVVDLNFEIGVL